METPIIKARREALDLIAEQGEEAAKNRAAAATEEQAEKDSANSEQGE
jgi:hypothetical protein